MRRPFIRPAALLPPAALTLALALAAAAPSADPPAQRQPLPRADFAALKADLSAEARSPTRTAQAQSGGGRYAVFNVEFTDAAAAERLKASYNLFIFDRFAEFADLLVPATDAAVDKAFDAL